MSALICLMASLSICAIVMDFSACSEFAMQIDFEEAPPIIHVTESHWAKTWLLHPEAPVAEKPAVIQDLHAKIKAKMSVEEIS